MLAAIPFWYLMTFFPGALLAGGDAGDCIGVYLCHQTAKDMGVHDHGSIVWDQFIGMWITLMALPTNDWQWLPPGLRFPYSGYVETVADPLVRLQCAWRHGDHDR
ncbi:phosphatidylglycerophosphatase A [Escherichia coli]